VSFALGDVVPHIIIRSLHLRVREFEGRFAKRLLQQNLPKTDVIGKSVLQERLVFLVELFAGFKVEIFARLAAPSDLPLLL
jgi:hypothetical protein